MAALSTIFTWYFTYSDLKVITDDGKIKTIRKDHERSVLWAEITNVIYSFGSWPLLNENKRKMTKLMWLRLYKGDELAIEVPMDLPRGLGYLLSSIFLSSLNESSYGLQKEILEKTKLKLTAKFEPNIKRLIIICAVSILVLFLLIFLKYYKIIW